MYAKHIPMHRRRLAAGLVGLVVLVGSAVSQQSFAQTLIDYDTDDDGLIEVDSLAKLNAIRYDLDGDGTPTPSNMSDYAAAFPTPATPMCNTTCEGYELMADLNFDTSGDNRITTDDDVLAWGESVDAGNGWRPIGTEVNRFTAEFNGNGHTISHLFIHRTDTDEVGLFGFIGTDAVIRNVGLVRVNVTGDDDVGGLAGRNGGTILASYAAGEVSGRRRIGGLVAFNNRGTIRASYASGEVSGDDQIGGLAGRNFSGSILASYATGEVSGMRRIGGLVGEINQGTILASYAAGEVTGTESVGGLVGSGVFSNNINDSYFDTDIFGSTGTEGRTTEQLQMPTTYTGIYENWNVDMDNADTNDDPLTGGDDPWHFGTTVQYPILQVDFDGDGVKSWEEFGPQSRPGVFVSPGSLSLTEGEMGSYTVVLLTTPTVSVTVTPEPEDNVAAVSVSGALIFMPGNWDMEQTVMVRAVDDGNIADEVVPLTHVVTGADSSYASVTVRDVTVTVTDKGAGVVVSPERFSLMEEGMGSYTAVLLSMPESMVTVTPESSNPAAVSIVNDGALIFTPETWNTTQTVMVRAENDANAVDETVLLSHMVVSSDSDYASVPALVVTVDVEDNDGGGIRVRVRVFLEGPLR